MSRFTRKISLAVLSVFLLHPVVLAVESGRYRLLSITQTSKLILVSHIPNKTKYVLDAASSKITVNGKPAEFQDLKAYTVVQVKFEPRKFAKDGIEVDGTATEILISIPENLK